MMKKKAFLWMLVALLLPILSESAIETNETRLYRDLFKKYNKFTHPVIEGSNQSLRVEFDYQLIRIIDVYWKNELLTWDPDKYGGITKIHVDPKDVWVPDVLLYNNVDEEDRFGGGQYTYRANVALRYNGKNTWLNPAIFKSICHVDVTYFPFDDQECYLKFGSWSFDISKVDMHPQDFNVMNKNYIENGEWDLERIISKRNEVKYKCCKYAFADVTITITISRVSLDYIMKLIIPCSLISSMIFLGFVLPPESGERIGLSITVLLAMTVFQQLTSELMPSYGFPLLGQYYFATMTEIGASLAVTTFILNFYHRSNRRMPKFLRTFILSWLAKVAFPFRKNKITRKSGLYRHNSGRHADMMNMDRDADSFSLVESIIDNIDHKNQRNNIWDPVQDLGDNYSLPVTMETVSMDNVNFNSNRSPCSHSNNRRVLDKGRIRRFRAKQRVNQNGYTSSPSRGHAQSRRGSHFVTGVSFGRLVSNGEDYSEEHSRNQKEWMKAARVLDRLFLIVSVLIGTVTLFAIFLRAPRFRLI